MITILPMKEYHIPDVVKIHKRSFPRFFLTFLGSGFLKLLYTEILKSSDHIAFVAKDQTENIQGFVVGVTHQSNFYSNLIKKRWLLFMLASFGSVIRHPSILPRLIRALFYSRSTQQACAQALLMSIAVLPDVEGLGIGQLLVTDFLSSMKQRQVLSVSLTTDRDGNERANHFYQKLGFHLARTYITREGRRMNEYVIELSEWTVSTEINQ